MQDGREGERAFGQTGEEGSFGKGQVASVLGEVVLGGSFKAVHAAAEVDLIGVEGEDLLLGEGALDLDGEVGLLDFAPEIAVVVEEEIASELHGEGGRALAAGVGADVVDGGAEDAEDIDAPVGLEGLVFDGDDGLAEHGGEVVVADDVALLEGNGADEAAAAVVEFGGG